jgi:hypothetical protein
MLQSSRHFFFTVGWQKKKWRDHGPPFFLQCDGDSKNDVSTAL